MDEYLLIDLADYRHSGEGANGESLDCLSDPLVMVKMYNTGYPQETIFEELEVARKVYDLGIPSPQPGELVTDGERLGIRFRRIVGKRSFSRMLADEPERTEEYSREFARLCRDLHKVKAPKGMFPDARAQFVHMLETIKSFSEAEKQKVADFINAVPDTDTVLHGDMHIGNVITTLPKGAPLDTPHESYFIDLGYFSHGCPWLDLGMMRMICISSDDEFRYESMHVHGDQTALVWKYFVDEYFGGTMSLEAADELIKPYQAVKSLLVAYNMQGFLPPEYERLLREQLL